MTLWHVNAISITGPLSRFCTSHQWISSQMASKARRNFVVSCVFSPNKLMLVWDAMTLMWCHSNASCVFADDRILFEVSHGLSQERTVLLLALDTQSLIHHGNILAGSPLHQDKLWSWTDESELRFLNQSHRRLELLQRDSHLRKPVSS